MKPGFGDRLEGKPKIMLFMLCCLVTRVVSALAQPPLLPGLTERVSVSSSGLEANAASFDPSISADGRYIAFASEADNLVPDDVNETGDVFVNDRQWDTITRVTGWGGGGLPHISADGYHVVFASADSNLVPGDTNGVIDVFVYDRQIGTVERVSVNSYGQQADGHSDFSFISADGRYTVFRSAATNLVATPSNNWSQIFVHDRVSGVTEIASVNLSGEPGAGLQLYPTISADGRYVAFSSSADNLVPDDTNNSSDVFARDRQLGLTIRVSVNPNGDEGNGDSTLPAVSANGRYIVFSSWASNLISGDANNRPDAFVYDMWTEEIELAGLGSIGTQAAEGSGGTGGISAEGRYVTFVSFDSNLVVSDTNDLPDIFMRDRLLGITERVNVDSTGQEANGYSSDAFIAANGRYVTFVSGASNLVSGDTNGFDDVFVRDQPPASLALNHSAGAPGSYFTLTGSGFPLTATAVISVNGHLLGNVVTDATGGFSAVLTTTNASPGVYFVTANAGPYRATVTLILDTEAPIWPPDGSGPVFEIPAGIALTPIYLPVLVHQ